MSKTSDQKALISNLLELEEDTFSKLSEESELELWE